MLQMAVKSLLECYVIKTDFENQESQKESGVVSLTRGRAPEDSEAQVHELMGGRICY